MAMAGLVSVCDSEGIPHGKPLTGYWPCRDYPEWVDMMKRVIFQHKPDADIVFWSYNWGRQPEKERIELINSLPLDISLLDHGLVRNNDLHNILSLIVESSPVTYRLQGNNIVFSKQN